jgi:hypothetical protein
MLSNGLIPLPSKVCVSKAFEGVSIGLTYNSLVVRCSQITTNKLHCFGVLFAWVMRESGALMYSVWYYVQTGTFLQVIKLTDYLAIMPRFMMAGTGFVLL